MVYIYSTTKPFNMDFNISIVDRVIRLILVAGIALGMLLDYFPGDGFYVALAAGAVLLLPPSYDFALYIIFLASERAELNDGLTNYFLQIFVRFLAIFRKVFPLNSVYLCTWKNAL